MFSSNLRIDEFEFVLNIWDSRKNEGFMSDLEMLEFIQKVPRTYDLEMHQREIKEHTEFLVTHPNSVEAMFKRGFLNLNCGLVAPAKQDFYNLLNTNSKVVGYLYEKIKYSYVLYDFPTYLPPDISKDDYDRLFNRMTGPALFNVETENIPQALILYSIFSSDLTDSIAQGLLINTKLDNFKEYSKKVNSESSDIYHKFAVALISIRLTKEAVNPEITINFDWQKEMLKYKGE